MKCLGKDTNKLSHTKFHAHFRADKTHKSFFYSTRFSTEAASQNFETPLLTFEVGLPFKSAQRMR
jgi:hypothetical protein